MRDWAALKREYLTLRWRDLKEFAAAKGLPYQSVRHASVRGGWNKARTEAEQKAEAAAVREMVESETERLKRVREENFKAHTTSLAKSLQTLHEPSYREANPSAAIERATKGRMEAMGQPSQTLAVDVDLQEPLTEEELAEARAWVRRLGKRPN